MTMSPADKRIALQAEWYRLRREHPALGRLGILQWDRAKRRLGAAHFLGGAPTHISISRPFTETASLDELIDTVRHEAAHVLAGQKAGHGPAWKAWAVRLGARPERCAPPSVEAPERLWEGRCKACGCVVARRHRVTAKMHRVAHSTCLQKGVEFADAKLTWRKVA